MITILSSEKVSEYFREKHKEIMQEVEGNPHSDFLLGRKEAYEEMLYWLNTQCFYDRLDGALTEKQKKNVAVRPQRHKNGLICPECSSFWHENMYKTITFFYCPRCGQKWRRT